MYQQNKYGAIISDTAVSTYGGRVVSATVINSSNQPLGEPRHIAISADGPFLVPNRQHFLDLLGYKAKDFVERYLDNKSFNKRRALPTGESHLTSPLYVSLRRAIEDYELYSSFHTAVENRDSNLSGTESPVDKILSLADENNTSASITVQVRGDQLELRRNDLNRLSIEEKQALVFELAIRAVEKDDAAEAARKIQRLFKKAVCTPWVADTLMTLDRKDSDQYESKPHYFIGCKNTHGYEYFRAGLDPEIISSGAVLRQLERAFNDLEAEWEHLREFCEKFRPALDDVIRLATGRIVLFTIGKRYDLGLKPALRDVVDLYGFDSGAMSQRWAESAKGETNPEKWRELYALCRIFHPSNPEDSSKPAGQSLEPAVAEAFLSKGHQLGTTFNWLFGPPRLEILQTERCATLDGIDLRNTCVMSPPDGLISLLNCNLINTVVSPGIFTSVEIDSPQSIKNVTLVSAIGVKFLLPKGSDNFKITGQMDPTGLIPLVRSQPKSLDLRGVTLVDTSDYSTNLTDNDRDYLKSSCRMTKEQAVFLGILSDDTSSASPEPPVDLNFVNNGRNPNEKRIIFVEDENRNRDSMPTPALFEVLSSFLSQEPRGDLVRFRFHRDSIPRHDHQLVVEQFNEDTLVVYYHDPELFQGVEIRKVVMLTRNNVIPVLCDGSYGATIDARSTVLSNFGAILQGPSASAATDVSWAKKNYESPRVQWTEPEPLTDFVFIETNGQVLAERRSA